MGFLRTFDYYVAIQPPILTRLLQAAVTAGLNGNLVQQDAEETAQEEISEILRTHFDLSTAFNDTLIWNPNTTYNAYQLVELNFPAWQNQGYVVGSLISYTDKNAYLCVIPTIATDLPGTSPKWIKLGQQNALFYIDYPYPLFQLESGRYNIGSKVFWSGSNYIAQISSQVADQITRLNAVRINKVPFPNVFPNNSLDGVQAWGTGVPYSIVGGNIPSYPLWTVPVIFNVGDIVWYNGQVWQSLTAHNINNIPGTDIINWQLFPLSILIPSFVYPAWSGTFPYVIGQIINYNNQLYQSLTGTMAQPNLNITPATDIVNWQPVVWRPGDNRTRTLVKYMVDISLYHLHTSISPDNVPKLRGIRYEKALDWISTVRNISSNIPLLQPEQGGPIRFGGNTKRNNTW